MADPLDPTALVSLAKSLVSPSAALTSPTQALALLIHSVHSALAFRLIDPTPGRAAEHPNALPEHWPVPGAELKFKYRHHQSSLDFVVSVIDLGGRALIAGAAVENPRSTSFDLLLTDYFSPSALSPSSPLPVSALSPSNPFSSPTRLKDLVVLYRLNVLQKLIPGLSKEGYSELSERAAGAPAPRRRAHPAPRPYLPDAGRTALFRFGPGSDGVGRLGPGRRWGGDGYLPPMGAPPGARFDPVVPGNGPPGTGPLGGQGPQPGGGTGGGNGARRVHPDMEQPGPGSSRSGYDAMFG
ncbi:SPOSA6832_03825 [Sporobolomyces salmonicolor]|uniref:SPOSA6832_03825-mRNA-1:cds n=1 Tax=Sporidiobolus salmonicolor TaxID=5005 RepID=A0A0D6EQD3_SPOSA|nr:SPOSA6832_03825 [Sporobolomyces salmonicolor]